MLSAAAIIIAAAAALGIDDDTDDGGDDVVDAALHASAVVRTKYTHHVTGRTLFLAKTTYYFTRTLTLTFILTMYSARR